jgi:RNA polymerase sigma factor (sigma-70 family)
VSRYFRGAELDRRENRNEAEIFRGLGSPDPLPAWQEFLENYSPIILQVVRLFERDPDGIADCFLFVCEELSRNSFRRLRRFDPCGMASFATWLRLVVRRLCIDCHRKECGRVRVFDSVARLSDLDRAVFRVVYQDRVPPVTALHQLQPRFPDLTHGELSDSCSRVQRTLTPRQLWLLSTREPKLDALDALIASGELALHDLIRDPSPDPEALAVETQQHDALARALSRLNDSERLLIRLRYEQELTLEQIARLANLPDAQTVDRRLKKILAELGISLGKRRAVSV